MTDLTKIKHIFDEKWLETHFPAQGHHEIDIAYFRSLDGNPEFEKIKPILVNNIEREPDYYVMHFMYTFVCNTTHASEFYNIMMKILFGDIRCYIESIGQHVEGINKLTLPLSYEEGAPPSYEKS